MRNWLHSSASHWLRDWIGRHAFVVFVVLIPLAVGIGWNEHRANAETRVLTQDAARHAAEDD